MKIGWIGTGVMGASMAGHLLDAGHEVAVHSRTRAKAEGLLERGATWCESPMEIAERSEVICTMLGYPRDVEGVVFGNRGLLAGAKPGSTLIDFTTSSPDLACRIADEAFTRQVGALDAPVSGGDVGAREGTLSIMVGGEQETFEACLPILNVVGKTIVLQGGPGAGQHTKMVNQIVVATCMIGVCEGLLYARRAGLDPETVLESVGGGAATSWSLVNYLPRILKGDLEPGFYVEHFVKDMGIALEECKRMKIQLPGLELAHELYSRLVAMDGGRLGTQALILVLDEMNKN